MLMMRRASSASRAMANSNHGSTCWQTRARTRLPRRPHYLPKSPFRNPNFTSREEHALHEHSFIQSTEARLDEFLVQGTLVFNDLVDQRNMLTGTQPRLLDAANTLGLNRNIVGWIERRSTQDMHIFLAGAIFTFFCFWLIWHYLG
ncbi:hypothetical protein DFH09DRAFT_29737 [Mycena vulgaris]|nr:hypothetical protein DFH09DRAFT_29737 [Mycena vulgaris]